MELMTEKFPELFLDRSSSSPYLSKIDRFELVSQTEEFQALVRDNLLRDPAKSFGEVFEAPALTGWVQGVLEKPSI